MGECLVNKHKFNMNMYRKAHSHTSALNFFSMRPSSEHLGLEQTLLAREKISSEGWEAHIRTEAGRWSPISSVGR